MPAGNLLASQQCWSLLRAHHDWLLISLGLPLAGQCLYSRHIEHRSTFESDELWEHPRRIGHHGVNNREPGFITPGACRLGNKKPVPPAGGAPTLQRGMRHLLTFQSRMYPRHRTWASEGVPHSAWIISEGTAPLRDPPSDIKLSDSTSLQQGDMLLHIVRDSEEQSFRRLHDARVQILFFVSHDKKLRWEEVRFGLIILPHIAS